MKASPQAAAAAEAFEKTSMQRDAFLLLKDMIEQGRIRPGEKLLEVQVAKAFGISRSPARHALRALCEAKIVRPLEGRGYQVAGRPKAEHVGQIASLGELRIAPLPQWERVYKKVEQELCIRVLFGSVRITEAALAEFFNVSRTVARDVLARMHSVGMVGKDGLGHWIAPHVSADKIRELFEIRAILEPEALVRAAPLAPAAELERMHADLRRAISNGPVEIGPVGQLETDLHIRLLDHCPNREIVKALQRTHILFVPTLYLLDSTLSVPQGTMHDALEEHLAIIEQLRRDNVRKAAKLLREHLGSAATRWLERFEIFSRAERLPLPPYLSPFKETGSS
ncbi:GntR family transcriptional regulator [Bradyrhizobium sp. BRP22]|uniref:GntR family transcriptional regulator n=1 Tax=Bradyrhizobium sp. BRP22 TaxID=2793821 RepID=UPI001CD6ACB1|nr:GntR family transcriptional regulator [Bradyrhizobium sp. BRP22]MCA1453277.1 GntR family transcriptional regulator [Bradyrhizobium sp. BRP22]